MKRTLWWRQLLVLAVALISILLMYPPQTRLKPGLDLAGGTTLTYQVDVAGSHDPKKEIEDVITILQRRVDPTGVRNLVWRPVQGNRIEIQMALPSQVTLDLRATYLQARDALLANNLSPRKITEALRAPTEQRAALVTQAAAGNPQVAAALEKLFQAHDALNLARAPYEQAQQRLRTAERALSSLPAETPLTQREAMQTEIAGLKTDLLTRTQVFVEARRAFETAQRGVLLTNIEEAEIDRVFALSNRSPKASEPSPRQAAIDAMLQRHPERRAELEALITAFNQYDQVRGPLDDPNDLIALLRGSGVLEFRIAPSPSDLPDLENYREQLRTKGPRFGRDQPYRWLLVDDVSKFADSPRDAELARSNPEAFFASRGLIAQAYGGDVFVLLANGTFNSLTQQQEGWELDSAFPTADDMGMAAISFRLNPVGAGLMAQLTGNHLQRPMAIILDGKVMSAPTIQSRISDSGIITGGRGGFGADELNYLLLTLKAGSLKARLSENPISIQTIGPQFGQDNLRRGLQVALWSVVVVIVFMGGYYFLFGMVAAAMMMLNVAIVLGCMAMVEATFTLPGIAGVILTIGVAVDANVLVYERIREELERQADIRAAVRAGFDRALAAIIDSNVTTLITCVILYYTASADIKGFALTLGIGLAANMFTGVFGSRVLIDTFISLVNPKTMHMLPMVWPALRRLLTPNIDWIGKRYAFFTFSLIISVLGIAAMFSRGIEFLDIEFRSGTAVTFQLGKDDQGNQQTLSLAQVRERLQKAAVDSGIKELADATPVTVGQQVNGVASEFSIATIASDAAAVSSAIQQAFADVLDVPLPISFAQMDAADVASAPVYPVRAAMLGASINRSEITDDVSEYVGGVAIVLEQLSPPTTEADLEARIKRLRMQGDALSMGPRQFDVVPLETSTQTAADGSTLYQSVIVLVRDNETNYVESPDAFTEKGGLAESEFTLVRDALQRQQTLGSVTNFSSQVSDTMKLQAIAALSLSSLAIVAYVWLRFGNIRFGIAAIVATLHDVTVAVGLLALSGWIYDTTIGHALNLAPFRINLSQIAAILTLIGYSLNDTVVVFDRIRENRGRLATATPAIINNSINQTISRTVLTGGTTIVAVLLLYIFGGEGVHGFAFTMLIGIVVGTYSSVAIASPLLLLFPGNTVKTQGPLPADQLRPV